MMRFDRPLRLWVIVPLIVSLDWLDPSCWCAPASETHAAIRRIDTKCPCGCTEGRKCAMPCCRKSSAPPEQRELPKGDSGGASVKMTLFSPSCFVACDAAARPCPGSEERAEVHFILASATLRARHVCLQI